MPVLNILMGAKSVKQNLLRRFPLHCNGLLSRLKTISTLNIMVKAVPRSSKEAAMVTVTLFLSLIEVEKFAFDTLKKLASGHFFKKS